jgi:RNA 2',3'-cyclic 3'-phosphodiesterase
LAIHEVTRLFVGLELPPACKAELVALNPDLNGVRWLGADHLHLTLSFLGEVEASVQERLSHGLGRVGVAPFFLPLRGVGVFSSHGRPFVIWAGVGRGHPHLFALHQRIQNVVLKVGLDPDLRPFQPHVTIGRAKGVTHEALRPFLRRYAETEFGIFRVTGFALYSSTLTSESAVYEVIFRHAF